MALVAYSDSEGSDTESPAPAPSLPPKPAAKSSLSSFLPPPAKKRKLVDDNATPSASGPRKIKVDLPKITADVDEDDSLSSRKRIGKSGGGGGMLSFLPAPKKTGADAVKAAQAAEEEEKQEKTGVNGSVSAAPASSGTAPRTLGGGIKKVEYAGMEMQPTVEDEPELPLNSNGDDSAKPVVAAKPAGPVKGRAIQPFFRKTATKKTTTTTTGGANGTKKEEKKVSLFSLGSALTEKAPTNVTTAPGEYKPLIIEETSAAPVVDAAPVEEVSYEKEEYVQTSSLPAPGAQTFQSISEEVGMDEAEMRMFMGRRGRNAEIKLSSFNVDAEYDKNEKARIAGELAPEKTVVRSIKPGKHSLSSLVNAAQSQKSALEESFAEGRRNKKESGSKYGW